MFASVASYRRTVLKGCKTGSNRIMGTSRQPEFVDGSNVCGTFLTGALVFFSVLSTYGATLQSGVPGGDSGELISEACQFGVAHPPGYPTFTLLTRWATQALPLKPAVAANLASACFGATAALFISLTIERWASVTLTQHGMTRCLAACCGGWAFAFSELSWLYSIGAEVFALNNLCASLIVYLSVLYCTTDEEEHGHRRSIALVGAFACGFGLTNQHTAIFFVLVIGSKVLVDTLAPGSTVCSVWTELGMLGLSGLAGLLPYAYLPLSAATPQKGSWGNASGLAGFRTHVLREEYGTFSLSPGKFQSEGLVERTAYYAKDVLFQFHAVGFILAAVGGATTLKVALSRKKEGNDELHQATSQLVWAMFVVYVVMFHSLSNLPLSESMPFEVHRRFWMQPNIIVAVWVGIGLTTFFEQLRRRKLFHTTMLVIPLALVAVRWNEFFWNMKEYNGRLGSFFEQQARIILKTVPASSLVVSFTDLNWNSVRYMQTCEQKRLDVTHLNFQLMPFPWFTHQHQLYPRVAFPKIQPGASMEKGSAGHAHLVGEFLRANIDNFPSVFIDLQTIGFDQFEGENIFAGLQFVPHGVLWRVTKPSKVFNYVDWMDKFQSGAASTMESHLQPLPARGSVQPGSWEEAIIKTYFDARYQTFLFQLVYAIGKKVNNLKDFQGLLQRGGAASFLDALFTSFRGLHDLSKTLGSHPHTLKAEDVFKNAALAASRTVSATAWLPSVSKHNLPDKYDVPLQTILPEAVDALKRFLRLAPNDRDAPVFVQQLQVFERLLADSSPQAGMHKTGADKKPKKRQKKKKKRKTNNT